MRHTICPACGSEIEFGYVFCVQCGERVPEEAATDPIEESTATEDVGASTAPDVSVEDAFFTEPKTAAAPAPAPEPEEAIDETVAMDAIPEAAPAPEPETAPAPAHEIRIQVLKAAGGGKGSHAYRAESVLIGRDDADLTFPQDDYLSSPHLRLFALDGKLMAEDLSSHNGFYRRVTEPVELAHGSRFLVGEQIMRFEYVSPVRILKQADGTYFCGSATPAWKFRLVQVLRGGIEGAVSCFSGKVATICREDGDLNFPEDRFMSYQHAMIEAKNGRYYLVDRNSRNGTYLQVDHAEEVATGGILAFGHELVKVDLEAV